MADAVIDSAYLKAFRCLGCRIVAGHFYAVDGVGWRCWACARALHRATLLRTLDERAMRLGARDMDEGMADWKSRQPVARPWWEVLGLNHGAYTGEVQARFRELAREHHPDRGGDAARFAEITAAYHEAMNE